MTSTRPPRAPLPDWSEGIREGTASLTVDPEDEVRPLAMGTSEDDTSEALALPPVDRPIDDFEERTKADDQAAGDFAPDPAEDRTKVDVRMMRPRPPRKGIRADDDDLSLVGATLGSYRLLARIGKGGMGHVYRAEHVRLGREVALKLLRQDYAKRKDAVARFFQEARTVNRVRHRNIVDVTDFVELDDGATFLIMELLTGQSLSSWVRSGIEVPRALGVIAQICEGLAAAHSVSVVHRDLKPDNVIITCEPDGSELVKLLDFGVAKLINQGDDDFGVETAAGSVVGTPAYMSPEQAGGLPIDGRSDIYSLGAIMYELFAGQPMFRGRSFGEFVRKHLTEQPPSPRSTPRGARLDPRIEQIILRAIEKEPARRYQAVTELRDALLVLLGDFQALGQSGQRRLAPLPGESARLPAIIPAGASSNPGTRPPSPAPADITVESEELSRSGARLDLGRIYGQHGQHSTHMVRTTPWYVWFGGGALAVGLGIGGATWYARSIEAKPAPSVQPLAAAAALIEIHLSSQPADAGVYKEGSTTELCRTPCALNLDPAELGDITVRPFVLRREGFANTNLVVDLRQPQREFRVALAPPDAGQAAGGDPGDEPARPEPTPSTDVAAAPVAEDSIELSGAPDQASAPPTTKPAAPSSKRPMLKGRNRRSNAGSGSTAGDDDATFELPADEPPARPDAKPEAKPDANIDAKSDPATKPEDSIRPTSSPDPSRTGKIDRSETIDPFRTRP